MSAPISATKRSIRNGGIFSFIIAAIGVYQGETLLSALMVWIFAWVVIGGALWLSYRMTAPKSKVQPEDIEDKQETK